MKNRLNDLILYLSTKCTNQCRHCGFQFSPHQGEHMSKKVFDQAMEIMEKENYFQELTFFGGEPLINPDFFYMLERGVKSLTRINLLKIATNCRPLNNKEFYRKFLNITHNHKKQIYIVTANDQYHLEFFDPRHVIKKLQADGYMVIVNDNCDECLIETEHIKDKIDFSEVSNESNCCNYGQARRWAISAAGQWLLCMSSLLEFGSIQSVCFEKLNRFSQSVPIKYTYCTECLKDFPQFHEEFKLFLEAERETARAN